VRARTPIFVLVGAILTGVATFLYALTRDPDGWYGLTMKELAIWSIVLGTSAGALLGLVVAWVTLPSVRRRTRFLILGAMCGVLVGLVYGFSLEELSVKGSLKVASPQSSFFGWEFAYMATVAFTDQDTSGYVGKTVTMIGTWSLSFLAA
jgi:hypothetical protein